MGRPKTDDIDPHTLARDLFHRLGGIDGMTRWAKNKQTLAYQLIANLMKQPASTTFNKVTIKVNDGEAARRKLEDAFLQLIESRKYEGVDPAVFINNERVIEHVSHTPASPDPAPSTDATRPATADTRPATADPRSQPPDAARRPVQFSVPGQGAGAALDGSDDNRSTTQKYLDWSGHGKLF
jgi:hypothetical protein